MQTSYSADVDHIDEPLQDADAERKAGETIRIRVQPSLFRRTLGQHRMWAGVSWTVDCQTMDEAIALREAMRAFFEAAARIGPQRLQAALDGLPPP
jgi:hypothetical protein